jgi:hypothetical protein
MRLSGTSPLKSKIFRKYFHLIKRGTLSAELWAGLAGPCTGLAENRGENT